MDHGGCRANARMHSFTHTYRGSSGQTQRGVLSPLVRRQVTVAQDGGRGGVGNKCSVHACARIYGFYYRDSMRGVWRMRVVMVHTLDKRAGNMR